MGSFSFPRVRVLLNYSLPYIPHKLQGQTMQLFSLFIVNNQMGITVAGIYSVINKFVKPLWLVVQSVQKAWVPYRFHLHKENQDNREVFRKISGNYWFALLLIWSVGSIVAPDILNRVINERYHEGISYFPFLAFIPVCQGFYFTVNTGIELNSSQRILPVATFFGMATVVVLSLLTVNQIPPYGPIMAQSISFIVIGVITFREARKTMIISYPFSLLFSHALLSISVVSCCYIFPYTLVKVLCIIFVLAVTLLVFARFNGKNLSDWRNYLIKKTSNDEG